MKIQDIRKTYTTLVKEGMSSLDALNQVMVIHYGANFKHNIEDILTFSNAKTKKGEKLNVLTGIMYLASHNNVASNHTVCPNAAIASCASACLYTAGRGRFANTALSRIRKTLLYILDKDTFFKMLDNDTRRAANRAAKLGFELAVRLNGTSDVAWENTPATGIMKKYGAMMYDYTKIPARLGKVPSFYHLTLSYSASNPAYQALCEQALIDYPQTNLAVVFRSKGVRDEYMGRRVINGDETDIRYRDEPGVIVGLYAKGRAKKDYSGFVVE